MKGFNSGQPSSGNGEDVSVRLGNLVKAVDRSGSTPIAMPVGLEAGFVLMSPEDADIIATAEKMWFDEKGYCVVVHDGSPEAVHRIVLRRILGRGIKTGLVTDHIDRNPANNSRHNLRETDRPRNAQNCTLSIANKSGVKGVRRLPDGRFEAYITRFGRRASLGLYETVDEAADVRRAAEFFLEDPDHMPASLPPDVVPMWAQKQARLYLLNKGKRRGSSIYAGVSYRPHESKKRPWLARAKRDIVGRFPTEVEAARARDAFVLKHGHKLQLNFPSS
jgi:hypothetical protein